MIGAASLLSHGAGQMRYKELSGAVVQQDMTVMAHKINAVKTLQAELSNREGYITVLLSQQAIPLGQHIKGRHGKRQPHLKILT
jgi:hypothetical protein